MRRRLFWSGLTRSGRSRDCVLTILASGVSSGSLEGSTVFFKIEHNLGLLFCTTSLACLLLFGCGSDKETDKQDTETKTSDASCTEPENPYSQGTGHYAGYEWAEQHGGSCNGRSQSFNEGCEEYENQEAEYEECERGKR